MKLRIQELVKTYKGGVKALDHVSLDMEHGMFGLLGPNGAGKSTLMQIMATLLPPTTGTVQYGEYRIGKDDHEIRKLLGYLPQSFGMYNKLTGREFLDYICILKGVPPSDRRRTVDTMLERVNLMNKAGKRIRTYSGGMKQRVGIAQALIGDPKVLIVDEPTAGLDPEERARFRDLLEDLGSEKIVLLSTHIVADIETSCRKLAIMNKGTVKFQGSPSELMDVVQGKVWSGTVPVQDWEAGRITGACVRRRKVADGYELRVLGDDQPFEGAVPVPSQMEDGYMFYVGGAAHA